MTTASLKNFISLLLFAIAFINESKAAATANIPEFEEVSLEPRRFYGLVQDSEANKSALRTLLGTTHIDVNPQAAMAAISLPASVDLRSGFPDPFDQGKLGSCTGQALVSAVLFDLKKQGQQKPDMRSVLYLYWQERKMEGRIGDTGATLTSGIKVLHTIGVCKESLWPYNISTYANTPTAAMDADAATCKDTDLNPMLTDSLAPNITLIKETLYQQCPIVGGIPIFESFESLVVRLSGKVPMPQPNEKRMGNHAVVFAGYDDSKNAFLMRNSWGSSWGEGGYFWLPYDYVPSYAFDLWRVNGTSLPPLDPNPPAPKKCCIIL